MNTVVRRVAVCAVIGGALLVGAALNPAPTSAQSCDPAYIGVCVPAYSEVGDLDCDYFYAQGIYNIQLADTYKYPHGLDGWNYVDDGIGCEGY